MFIFHSAVYIRPHSVWKSVLYYCCKLSWAIHILWVCREQPFRFRFVQCRRQHSESLRDALPFLHNDIV